MYPTFSALLVNTKSEPRRLKGMYFLLLIWTIVVETCSSSSFDPKLFQKCSEIRESAPFEIIIEYLMDYFIPNMICFVILSWFKRFWRSLYFVWIIMITTKLCKWLNKNQFIRKISAESGLETLVLILMFCIILFSSCNVSKHFLDFWPQLSFWTIGLIGKNNTHAYKSEKTFLN